MGVHSGHRQTIGAARLLRDRPRPESGKVQALLSAVTGTPGVRAYRTARRYTDRCYRRKDTTQHGAAAVSWRIICAIVWVAAQEGIGSTQPGFKTIQVCPRTCRLACGPLNVSLEQTMLSGTSSHPNVAYTPLYRLMAHTSRMLCSDQLRRSLHGLGRQPAPW